MSVLLNPFRLFGRLMIAGGKIFAYTIILCIEIPWFIWFRHPDEIMEAFAIYLHRVTDATFAIVERD